MTGPGSAGGGASVGGAGGSGAAASPSFTPKALGECGRGGRGYEWRVGGGGNGDSGWQRAIQDAG